MMPKKLAFAKKKQEMESEEESDALTCPKCGAELADTPDNRAYAKKRKGEMKGEMMDDEEYEDEEYED